MDHGRGRLAFQAKLLALVCLAEGVPALEGTLAWEQLVPPPPQLLSDLSKASPEVARPLVVEEARWHRKAKLTGRPAVAVAA